MSSKADKTKYAKIKRQGCLQKNLNYFFCSQSNVSNTIVMQFSHIISWLMVSNASDRSKTIPKVVSFLSIVDDMLKIKSVRAKAVEWLFRLWHFLRKQDKERMAQWKICVFKSRLHSSHSSLKFVSTPFSRPCELGGGYSRHDTIATDVSSTFRNPFDHPRWTKII